jgi:sulfotransferase family protein
MGVGRSGSTILGVVLGNLKKYFFGGEMHLWIESKGVPTERDYAIEYWKKIADNIPEREDYFNINFDRQLEFHTALPAVFGSGKTPIIKKFHTMSQELFTSVQKVSGCDVVVDSSHYPLRAYWLNKNPALDMYYIYLYRNPVDAVNALMKKDVEQTPKSFFGANLYLFWVSLLSNIVYAGLPKSKKMKLRYEDLIKSPCGVINKVQTKLHTPQQSVDFNNLSTGFIFRANRIRLYKTIKLETQLKKTKTNFFLKSIVYLLHFPFILLNSRKY